MSSMLIWDEQRKEELKRLLDQNYSANQIAAILSNKWAEPITRNAILGVKNRMGLCSPAPIGPRKPAEGRSRKRPSHYRKHEARPKRTWLERRLEKMPRPPTTAGIPFLDRAPYQCAFPVEGEGLSMLCCGAHRHAYGGHGGIKRTTFPYCNYHCHVAYRWVRTVDDQYEKAAEFLERLTGRPDAC